LDSSAAHLKVSAKRNKLVEEKIFKDRIEIK